jgi:hypothetical protein
MSNKQANFVRDLLVLLAQEDQVDCAVVGTLCDGCPLFARRTTECLHPTPRASMCLTPERVTSVECPLDKRPLVIQKGN